MTVEAAIKEVKRIGIKDGDIVVFSSEGPIEDQFLAEIARSIKGYMGINVLVINLTENQKIETIPKGTIKASDLVIFRSHLPESTADMYYLSEQVGKQLGFKVRLIGLHTHQNIESISDKDMNAAGWCRMLNGKPDGPHEERKSIEPSEPWPDPE